MVQDLAEAVTDDADADWSDVSSEAQFKRPGNYGFKHLIKSLLQTPSLYDLHNQEGSSEIRSFSSCDFAVSDLNLFLHSALHSSFMTERYFTDFSMASVFCNDPKILRT